MTNFTPSSDSKSTQTSPESLRNLITRLEAVDTPDRELDAKIEVLLFGGDIIQGYVGYTMQPVFSVRRPSINHYSGFSNNPIRPYTTSLDSSLELLMEKLPTWCPSVRKYPSGTWECCLWLQTGNIDTDRIIYGASSIPAIAVLISLLKALEPQ